MNILFNLKVFVAAVAVVIAVSVAVAVFVAVAVVFVADVTVATPDYQKFLFDQHATMFSTYFIRAVYTHDFIIWRCDSSAFLN